MMPAFFRHMKRRGEVEDLPPLLHRGHTPGRETAAIAGLIHLINDGHRRIAGSDEIAVQTVASPILDGTIGRRQGLGHNLPAKDTAACLSPMTQATKQVHLKLFQLEQVQQGR